MRLFRVLLEVNNLELAVEFYSQLLGYPGQAIRGGRHYFTVGDGLILTLLDVWSQQRALQTNAGDYYFAVDDLEEVHTRARSMQCLSDEVVHGECGGQIATRPWGERSFYARDPFGNGLCFVDERTIFTGE